MCHWLFAAIHLFLERGTKPLNLHDKIKTRHEIFIITTA
jgi:hypothetical protein